MPGQLKSEKSDSGDPSALERAVSAQVEFERMTQEVVTQIELVNKIYLMEEVPEEDEEDEFLSLEELLLPDPEELRRALESSGYHVTSDDLGSQVKRFLLEAAFRGQDLVAMDTQ
ncbi:unnamed protein product [Darwinula stevensoni]|uniref:Uncharacterized protein n=1 Tax=Darwinula stevensoni TaxID=69355 RepID=A0A7R9A3G4_9CRUS|nr:unnamed protein product [Darwinula stevensoni]CAG0882077.1 unnamed protein product [Darwinula stevensoni]